MKVCFLLQRRFAYVGHAMAAAFKKRYGVDQFCGYVYSRSSLEFLKSQKEINYTKLLLDEDIHPRYKDEPLNLAYLKWLEKEYGTPNLWPFIDIDRIIRHGLFVREYPMDTPKYTHEEMMRLTQVYAKAIIKFLDEEKPNVIIFSVVGTLSTMLLYYIAKKKGIKTLFIETTRVGTRYTVTENYGDLSYVQNTFKQLQGGRKTYPELKKQAEQFLWDFQKTPTAYNPGDTSTARPTNRKKQFSFLLPKNLYRSLCWAVKPWTAYLANNYRGDYTVIKPWHHTWDRIKRKFRVMIGFDDLYDNPDPLENFAFFALQLEPEINYSLTAPFYKDQAWVIKQIARSLPIHFKLYVKEHPAMYGYRTRKFYKELTKNPNVKLIRPTESSLNLIRGAKLVLTLTSTAAWEGILLKKPAITFGDTFFNTLPMVKKCRTIEDLPCLIQKQLENFQYDEKALLNMLTAAYEESADLDLVQIWDIEGASQMEKKKRAVIPFVDYIAEKLSLKPIQN